MKDIFKPKKQLIKELEETRRLLSQRAPEGSEGGVARRDAGSYRGQEVLVLIRKAIDSATDAIGLSDPEGHHIYHNKAFTSLFEYTTEELEAAGGGPAAFSVKSIARDVFGTIMKGNPWSGEVEMKAKSGRLFSLFLRADAIKDDTGKIVGLVGVFTDISERKRLEYELRKKHDELQLILDSIPAYVFYKDKHGKMLNINKSAASLSYVPKEKLLQRTVFDLTPQGADKYNRDDMEVIRSGEPKRNIEEPLVLSNGTRWLKTDKLPIKDDEGNVAGLVGFSVDITELKSAQEELREKEALLRTFFNSPGLICGIVELEVGDLRYITVNASFAEMYGLKPEEVSNRLASEIGTDRGIVELFIDNYKKSQKNNSPVYFEYHRGIGKDKQWLFVTVTFLGLEPVRYRPRFAFVSSDITERKRVEEALQASEIKLRQMFESMTDAVVLTDLNGNMLDINNSGLRMFGYKKDEVIGRNGLEILAFEEQDRALKNIAESMYGSEIAGIQEYRIRDRNNRVVHAEIVVNRLADITDQPYGFIVVIRDVTGMRLAQEALRESEAKFRFLTEKMNDVVWTLDMNLNTTYVSPSVTRMLGFTPEERIKQPFEEQLTPESSHMITQTLAAELECDGKPGVDPDRQMTVEMECYHKNGSTICMEALVSAIRDEKGKIIGIHGVSRDVTAKKAAEGALRESEQKLRWMFESIKDGIFIVGLDGTVEEVNRGVERITGYSRDQLLGRSGLDYMFPGFKGNSLGMLQKMIDRGGTKKEVIVPMKTATGGVIEVEATSSALRDSMGNPIGLIGTVRDVSERRRMEQAIRENEKRYRLLAENATDAIWTIDMNLKYTFISPAILRILKGYTLEELTQMSIQDMLTPESFSLAVRLIEEELAREGMKGVDPHRVRIVELELCNKDGSTVWTEIQASFMRDPKGNVTGVQGSTRDITERKKTEQKMKDSEARYRLLAENVSDIIWTMDLNMKYTYISPSVERMRGFTPEEFMGISAQETLSKESYELVSERLVRELEIEKAGGADPGRITTLELEMKKKDGSWMWAEVKITFMRDEGGKAIGMVGTTRDISERKKTQEALREANEKLQVTFDSIGEAVTVVDIDGRIIDANKEALRLHGFAAKEAIIGRKAADMVAPVDRERAVKDAIIALKSPYPLGRKEYKLIESGGREFDGEFNVAVIRDSRGNPSGFIGVARDISERKRMAEALKRSEEYFKAITENSSDMVIITEGNGDIKYCSPSMERFSGYKPEELVGKSAFTFIHPDDVTRAISDFGQAVQTRDVGVPNAFRIVHKDGSTRFFDGLGKNLLDNPSIAGFIMNVRDVTERRGMEEALRDSEEKLRVMFDSMMDGIVITDPNINIVDVNKAALEMMGEALKENLIGRSALDVIRFKDQEAATANLVKMLQEARPQEKVEYSVVFPSGAEMEIEVSTAMMHDSTGQLIGFVNAIRDVSERKKWEEALRKSEEKYRNLAETTNDMVYSIDSIGNLTFIGPQVARYGLDHEKMVGRYLLDFIYLEDREKVLLDFERTAKTGAEFPTEFRVIDADGNAHWIEEMGRLQRDASGAITGTTGVLRDITERKKAEEALRESETRFRHIMENSRDASYRRNLETNGYDYLSPVITKLTGYLVEEMTAMSEQAVVEHIHPDDREQVNQIFTDALSGRSRTYLVEYRFLCRDGLYRWMNDLGSIMLDEAGKAQFLVGSLRDISERKYSEEALRKSEEKYRNLVEREKDVIVSVDALGFVNSVNSAVSSWGYTPDEVLKMNFLDLIALEWREVTAVELQERLLKAGEYVGETMAIDKGGTMRPIEYSAVVVKEGGEYAGAQAIVRDISERKRSEEALQAKERYFRAISDLSSGAALVVNSEGVIIDVTGGLSRLSGHAREETIGRTAVEFIHPEDLDKAGATFEEALRNPSKTVGFESRLRNAWGEWQWTESMITNLLDHPDVHGIVNHLVDITERKKAEEAIKLQVKRTESLYGIAQVISKSTALDKMLDDAVGRVCEAMDTESGCIFMLDLDENALKLGACRGVKEDIKQQWSSIAMTEQGIENILEISEPITEIDEARDVLEPDKMKKVTADLGRRGIAATPFFRGKDFLGLIVVFTTKDRVFSKEDLDLFKAMANEVSIGINNLMLLEKTRELSVTDELTGLYNRRYFFEMLEVEMSRADRTKHPFSLVMIDLDGFKEYNDKYGHTNGDVVLQNFSQMLKSSIRKSDMAFRFGGDEFVLLLPSAEAGKTKKIIQRARTKWHREPLTQSKIFGGHVGFSSGIAEYPENAESPDGLIFLADAALYQAKKKGYEDKVVSELMTLSPDIIDVATQDQVYALAATVDARDPYTYGHSQRVADIAVSIGKQIGMSTEDLTKLHAAALLHDIGKVGVPDSILSKAGKPTQEEWDLIRKHCAEGARILGYVKELSPLVPVVLYHHEWYDGSGYPSGLKGLEIPSGARITSVADAYDTMVTKRPYSNVMTPKDACEELKRNAGAQFDPVIVDVWCKIVAKEGK